MENLVVNPGAWSGRRVFITGHTGFKGSWLSLWMQQLGAEVLGYSLPPPTHPNHYEISDVASGMKNVYGDVRDLEKLTAAICQFEPDLVLHLAAQSLVRPSYVDPVGTYATNVMGTVHVLEAIRSTESVRAAVIVTSDKCYENNEWVWGYRETDPMGGYDPYSNSKGCAELVTAAYRKSFFAESAASKKPAIATARAGNVIGGGDWAPDRLVPDFVRAAEKGEPIRVRNPSAQRPWQHVLEPLSGYLTLAERLLGIDGMRYASAWNFGPRDNDAVAVATVVERLTTFWGAGADYTLDAGPQLHEASFLKLDCAKSRAQLGWHPLLSVDSAIEWTIEWHKSMRAGAKMHDISAAQISRFSAIE